MDKVLADIKKAGIKNMMKYYTYEMDDDDLYIVSFDASKLYLNLHKHDGKICKFNDFLTLSQQQKYNRLFRLSKPDYYDYRIYLDYYHDYYCDNCDKLKHGPRYKCSDCINIDICKNCYYKREKKCFECNKCKLFKYDQDNIFPKSIKVII